MRKVTRYVERLLRQRRPRPFVPTDEQADAIRAAILLRGGQPETSAPQPEFIAGLRGRLAEEVTRAQEPEPEPQPERQPTSTRRRRILTGVSVAAASAAGAVALDRTLLAPSADEAGTRRNAAPVGTLSPDTGAWQPVLASRELPEGGASRFDTGTVAGFVVRQGGELSARSATCTHQGCSLGLNLPARQFECPCHATTFGLDGQVLHFKLAVPPARLPAIQVRETAGTIEVFVPKRS